MLGKNAARAAFTSKSAACSCASAAAMSGRRSSSAEGRPGATGGSVSAVSVPGRTVIASGVWPVRMPRPISCCSIWLRRLGISARSPADQRLLLRHLQRGGGAGRQPPADHRQHLFRIRQVALRHRQPVGIGQRGEPGQRDVGLHGQRHGLRVEPAEHGVGDRRLPAGADLAPEIRFVGDVQAQAVGVRFDTARRPPRPPAARREAGAPASWRCCWCSGWAAGWHRQCAPARRPGGSGRSPRQCRNSAPAPAGSACPVPANRKPRHQPCFGQSGAAAGGGAKARPAGPSPAGPGSGPRLQPASSSAAAPASSNGRRVRPLSGKAKPPAGSFRGIAGMRHNMLCQRFVTGVCRREPSNPCIPALLEPSTAPARRLPVSTPASAQADDGC